MNENLNAKVRDLTPSATVAINDRSNEFRKEGKEVFKLGLGQSPFPVPSPVIEALRRHAGEKDYLHVKGLWELREAVAAHHRRTFDIECSPEDVLIGPGSKVLMFLLQLVYEGDLVIPSPSWVSYAPQARIVGRNVCWLDTSAKTDWQPTAESLGEICLEEEGKPRILILNYPSNPTGRTLSLERLAELASVAKEKNVILLSDEIYGKLHHEGDHRSIVPLYPEGTIFSGGLSKWCGAGGWRLGLFVFPPSLRWLLDAMSAVATETFTSTSAPIQYAAVRAFQEDPEIEEYPRRARLVLKALGKSLTERLRKAGARVATPEGGFYLFPDLTPLRSNIEAHGPRTSAEMCERLFKDTGVACLPGSDFGRPPGELTMRLAYVDFDGEAALEAQGDRCEPPSEDFLTRHCGRVVTAIERICEWAHAKK